MVTTIQVKPAPLLQPFVHCYAVRIFSSEEGILKPHHAQPEYYLSFLLKKDNFCEFHDDTGNCISKLSSAFVTLLSHQIGYELFKGDYFMFSVQFKANGVSAIFGIPQRLLVDTLMSVEDILGNDSRLIIDQLESLEDIGEMGKLMDKYLVGKLLSRKRKTYTASIAFASDNILKNKGLLSIDMLAYDVNMSLRNFERRFIDEVGIPPKLYMRIIRFYEAIQNKMMHPKKTWTAICYESGYFDQAHFIKECREFSSKSPEELFRYTPPPIENLIEKTE